ncbi:MAG: DUF2155 domain-containing protein [Holosporaceae bacterium]|nr:DUF2155 domain-containing protein [Holosporaceae bacterium]
MIPKMQKVSRVCLLLFFSLVTDSLLFAAHSAEKSKKPSIKKMVQSDDFGDEPSIWESEPIEIDSVKIQILDKVSGKVYREIIKLNSTKVFGSIELKLKRCFKNGPEDNREISAFIEINEKNNVIFANWLFASAPSVNLFAHPVYDIRVEF